MIMYYINIIYHVLCVHIHMHIDIYKLSPQRIKSRYNNTGHNGFKKKMKEETIAKLNFVKIVK